MGDKVHIEVDPDLYGDGHKDPFIQDEYVFFFSNWAT